MRIPGSQRTETIPGGANVAPISPVAAAAPYQALAGMGEAISGLGEILLKRQQKMQELRDYNDATNAQLELEEYSRQKKMEVAQLAGQSALDIYPIYKQDFEKKMVDLSGKLSEGAKVVFEKLSRTEQEKYLGSLSGHVAAQTKAYNIDSRDAWLSGRLKAIAENPLSFDDEIRLGNAKIESSTPGPEGVLEKDKFYKTARAAQLDVLLKKDNLVALGISEEYVDSIRDQIGKDLYLEYKDKFKTRRAAIEAKQREEAKRIKSDYELQIGNTVSGHINNKSYPDAIVAIDDAKVDDTAKRKLYSLVNTAIKTGKETATDPGINAQLLLKLQDPSYPRSDLRQDIADAALAGQITAERGSTYYNGLDDPVFKDEYFKSINSMYRQHFGWSSASETFFHPEGAISYDMAVNKLLGRIRKEGLIGADIRKAGIEIGLPLFADFWVKTKFMSPAEAALNIKRLAESAGIKVRKPSVEELGGEEKKEGDVRRPLTSFYE